MTAAGSPVWLLDVDGVLNANRPSWQEAPFQGSLFAEGFWWKFRWSPSLLNDVRNTIAGAGVEVRWATTWIPYVRDLEELFRLPRLVEAFPVESREGVSEAKLAAALRVVEEENRPLIWTDDEVIPQSGAQRDRLLAAGALLVSPSSKRGLQPADMDAIRDFLSRH